VSNPNDNRAGPQGPYTGVAFITRPDGTNLYFDLTDEERHIGHAEVTDFPVEDGSDISDNMRVKPGPFTMRCTISNTPIVASGNQGGTYPGVSPYDQPTVTVDITPYKAPFNAVSALVNPVGTIINALQGPYGPQSFPLTVMFPDDFDGPTDALFILDAMQSNAELLQITTSLCVYENYVLEHYELVKDGGPWQMVDLTFKQLILIQTTTSATPFVSEPGKTPPKNVGAKSPTAVPPPLKSQITVLGNAAGNANAGAVIPP
jgi:hypothetical protein